MSAHAHVEPGTVCDGCGRRVPYPKKESSPGTVTRSFRLPTDEQDAFNENLAVACSILGLPSETKFAPYRFFRGAIQYVIANEDDVRGAFLRGEWD